MTDADASSRRINGTKSKVKEVTWYKWDLDLRSKTSVIERV